MRPISYIMLTKKLACPFAVFPQSFWKDFRLFPSYFLSVVFPDFSWSSS